MSSPVVYRSHRSHRSRRRLLRASVVALPPASIAAAAARIAAVLPPTPVIHAPGRGALLKLENLQVTGAFKVRGAFNAVASGVARGDRRDLVCASAGNHGLGVAWAARHFDRRAIVVVPAGAAAAKVRGCRALGAEVITGGADVEACLRAACVVAEARGARLLHPFDDPDVIAGQATVGVELLPLRPDVVLVPIGGGGLAAGVCAALRPHGVRVVGVQVRGLDRFRQAWRTSPSLSSSSPGFSPAALPASVADGLRVARPGALALSVCAALLDDIVLVSEDQIADTIASLAVREKVVAEGAGAAAVAALPLVSGVRKVAIVSGGNIDAGVLARLATRAA